MAILTKNQNEEYSIYIINTKSGRILKKIVSKDVSSLHSMNLIADDNSFFFSYVSKRTKKTEIKHIELFRRQLEKDFWQILTENMW